MSEVGIEPTYNKKQSLTALREFYSCYFKFFCSLSSQHIALLHSIHCISHIICSPLIVWTSKFFPNCTPRSTPPPRLSRMPRLLPPRTTSPRTPRELLLCPLPLPCPFSLPPCPAPPTLLLTSPRPCTIPLPRPPPLIFAIKKACVQYT